MGVDFIVLVFPHCGWSLLERRGTSQPGESQPAESESIQIAGRVESLAAAGQRDGGLSDRQVRRQESDGAFSRSAVRTKWSNKESFFFLSFFFFTNEHEISVQSIM